MSPQVDRNRTIVTHALDVYRAEMREFICKTLEQEATSRQSRDLILDALSEEKKGSSYANWVMEIPLAIQLILANFLT